MRISYLTLVSMSVAITAVNLAHADNFVAKIDDGQDATYTVNGHAMTTARCKAHTAEIVSFGPKVPTKQDIGTGKKFSNDMRLPVVNTAAHGGVMLNALRDRFAGLLGHLPLVGQSRTMLDYYVCNVHYSGADPKTVAEAANLLAEPTLLKVGTGDNWQGYRDSIQTEMTAAAGRIIYHYCPNRQATVIACEVPVLPKSKKVDGARRNVQSLEEAYRSEYQPMNFEQSLQNRERPELTVVRALVSVIDPEADPAALGNTEFDQLKTTCETQPPKSLKNECAEILRAMQ